MPVTVTLIDDQQVLLSANVEDSEGFPVPDTLTWSVDDPAVITLTVSEDNMSAIAVAGQPGQATVTVSDDISLTDTAAITVNAGPPASLVLTAGTPEDQPA